MLHFGMVSFMVNKLYLKFKKIGKQTVVCNEHVFAYIDLLTTLLKVCGII